MRRLATFVAITCATVLAVAVARANTLDDLKAELAAKKADVAKLERRIRQMEGETPGKAGVARCCCSNCWSDSATTHPGRRATVRR